MPTNGELLSPQVQPKDRILDVFATFVRPFGGWLSISALVELVGEFDVEAHSVRSATARLKRRGLVEPEKQHGSAGYRLTATATEILGDGDRRIFEDPTSIPNVTWAIALFSVPESQRSQRYVIRSRLARLGFAQGPSGAWFAPSNVIPETQRMLAREELGEFVSLWSGDYLGQQDLPAVVAEAWDLPEVHRRYEEFIALTDQISQRWEGEERSLRDGFVDYLNLMAWWRPLPYLDPGLPSDVTPDGWLSAHAWGRFTELNNQLRPIALQHYVSVAMRGLLDSARSGLAG